MTPDPVPDKLTDEEREAMRVDMERLRALFLYRAMWPARVLADAEKTVIAEDLAWIAVEDLAARGSVSLPNEREDRRHLGDRYRGLLAEAEAERAKEQLGREVIERALSGEQARLASLEAALRDLIAMLPSSSAPAAKRARAAIAAFREPVAREETE